MNTQYKHVEIHPHPLKSGVFGVFCITIKGIPPYFGTLAQCKRAADAAERNTEKRLIKA
jgi:hypothetical protein